MATAWAAIGTLLKREGVTVALVSDIEGPNLKGDTIDTTNHDNADMYKQFIVGLKEGGDVKLKLFWDPTDDTHTGLIDTFENRTLANWSITPPVTGTKVWTFTAVITQFDTKYKVKDAITADCTLKVSGKPTFA